ncbi:hypothetical protein [Saccharothrix sp. Mg75]|uniref:hypothetical protein n=1 Tax=Saccharothrix sp. Mg75 TaxID=3445357 RepID=UPI003EEBA3E7
MLNDLEYRAMLALDVQRSSGRGEAARKELRRVLFAELESSCRESGIEWAECFREDLGDGMMIVFPAMTAKNRIIHPLVPELAARLRAHNRLAGELTGIRVRVAVHAGDVLVDGDRIVGSPMELLARLLDAPQLRQALATAPESAPLALITSAHVHEEVVRHGYPGIDPDDFRAVAVEVKETAVDAWLRVAGGAPARDRRMPGTAGSAPAPEKSAPGFVQHNTPSAHGVVYASQGGNQHFWTGGPR